MVFIMMTINRFTAKFRNYLSLDGFSIRKVNNTLLNTAKPIFNSSFDVCISRTY